MQRYTVAYTQPDGQTTRLLVPFNSSATVGDFASEVALRLSRRGIFGPTDQLLPFHLGGVYGPILDESDSIESVILLPDQETLFVSSRDASAPAIVHQPSASREADQRNDSTSDLPKLPDGVTSFSVRVITPRLARQSQQIEDIVPLQHPFSVTSTLREIKSCVAEHLGHKPDDIIPEDGGECNCKFARSIAWGTTFQRPNFTEPVEPDSAARVLVVHSKMDVDIVSISNGNDIVVNDNLKAELEQGLNMEFEKKHISLHRGMRPLRGSAQTMTVGMLPVVAICSNLRHPNYGIDATSDKKTEQITLDLHVAEATIATTNLDMTVQDLSLQELLVNGVLNLYVITRKSGENNNDDTFGKGGIFLSDHCWKPTEPQSERGMAIFLSSLRVFSHIATSLESKHHNMLLYLMHSLTKFPPVIRAFDILMRRATPAPSDCAVIAQTMFEILRDVVPHGIIKFNPGRFFEGARLLFGLLLDKCKTCSMDGNGLSSPYQTSLKTIQAADAATSEPILYPVNTDLGLLEHGCFMALSRGLIRLNRSSD